MFLSLLSLVCVGVRQDITHPRGHAPVWPSAAEAPFIGGNVGDYNGDGIDDYLVCSPHEPAHIHSGADDAAIASTPEKLESLDEVTRSLFFSSDHDPHVATAPALEWIRKLPSLKLTGVHLLVPMDSNGPRWSERIAETGDYPRTFRWLRLDDTQPRLVLDPSNAHPGAARLDFFAIDCAWIEDLDVDGADDVLLHVGSMNDFLTRAEFDENPCGLVAFSSKTSKELWRVALRGLSCSDWKLCGWQNIVSPGDIDGDKTRDFVLADPKSVGSQLESPEYGSSILAVSGHTGAILWRQRDDNKIGELLGATLALVADRDADGLRDIVYANADDNEVKKLTLGIVSSKTGAIVKRFKP